MRIGLDLDGTVYANPEFFGELVAALSARGHRFFCISSHGKDEWLAHDVSRLQELGISPALISPELLQSTTHGHLHLKGAAADQCDVVFDDDVRLREFTRTPVFAPLPRR